jgi:hypothetical protein
VCGRVAQTEPGPVEMICLCRLRAFVSGSDSIRVGFLSTAFSALALASICSTSSSTLLCGEGAPGVESHSRRTDGWLGGYTRLVLRSLHV